jgi:hypothetical protein
MMAVRLKNDTFYRDTAALNKYAQRIRLNIAQS